MEEIKEIYLYKQDNNAIYLMGASKTQIAPVGAMPWLLSELEQPKKFILAPDYKTIAVDGLPSENGWYIFDKKEWLKSIRIHYKNRTSLAQYFDDMPTHWTDWKLPRAV